MSPRLWIAGGPRTGKSTLAKLLGYKLGIDPQHTDDLINGFGWSEASLEVSRWMSDGGPYILEGVSIPRAARKWLAAHPGDERPCEVAFWLDDPWVPLSRGQKTMAAGCLTVWREVLPELERRGARIQTIGHDYSISDTRASA